MNFLLFAEDISTFSDISSTDMIVLDRFRRERLKNIGKGPEKRGKRKLSSLFSGKIEIGREGIIIILSGNKETK